jgi:hypothetical protein
VICCTAVELPDEAGTADGDPAGVEVVEAVGVAADDVAADDEDDELELLQAETARASARPSTGARMIRRATSGNRMRVLSLGRMYY